MLEKNLMLKQLGIYLVTFENLQKNFYFFCLQNKKKYVSITYKLRNQQIFNLLLAKKNLNLQLLI